jgi:Phosphatidylserine/phosphatidylglycerophosphate/cardiolipin synthases and related enzymes
VRTLALLVIAVTASLLVGFAAGILARPATATTTTTMTSSFTVTRYTTLYSTLQTKVLETTTLYATMVRTTTSTIFSTVWSTTVRATTSTIFSTVWAESVSVLEVCFSRTMNCAQKIVSLIDSANRSVYVAVYSFTRDDIADALIRARERGLDVRVVVESERAYERGSEYLRLRWAGVDIRLDTNSNLMHHKFMVIDGKIVGTGSYNFSVSAEDFNDENFIVLISGEIAELYSSEFMRVWMAAQP